MIYPLSNWSKLKYGYKFGDRTWYNTRHIGVDKLAPKMTPVHAHDNGVATRGYTGVQGNYVHIIDSKGHLCRYMHLVKPGVAGKVKRGQVIGYVGNTGLSKGFHLHFDVSKGKVYVANFNNFINPEAYIKASNAPVAKTATVAKAVAAARSGASTSYRTKALYYKGKKFNYTKVVKGQKISGNDKWLLTTNGYYVWSGGIKY
jgi:hypothetical protein